MAVKRERESSFRANTYIEFTICYLKYFYNNLLSYFVKQAFVALIPESRWFLKTHPFAFSLIPPIAV